MKYTARFTNGAAFKPSDWGDEGRPIIRIAQLTGKDFDNYFAEEIDPRYDIDDGALLFSWSATLDSFIWDRGPAILNQHIFKVEPLTGTDKRFLYYSLKHYTQIWADVDAHGSTMRHIKKESLGNKIWFPELAFQTQIADFLDRETSRIDRLIEKKSAFVSRLSERISSVAEVYSTRGFNSASPTKPTGIDWLPEIPVHWDLKRAKFLFSEMKREPQQDDGVITAFRDGQVCLRSKRRTTGFTMAEKEVGYQRILEGDLVIHSMDAFAGAIGVSEDDGKATGEYAVCTSKIEGSSNEYYAHVLRSMAKRDFIFVLCPSVRERAPRFRFVRFAEVILPVPPVEEQHAISNAVTQESARLIELKSKTEKSITLLREKRAALITAAVTGQIAVSAAGAIEVSANDNVPILVAAEIIRSHERSQKFGRVKFQKIVYLAETHCGVHEFGGHYTREAAGPLDRSLLSRLENDLSEAELYRADQDEGGGAVTYTALGSAHNNRTGLTLALDDRTEGFTAMLDKLRDMDTHALEAIATLYAVWNDFLIDGSTADDPAIVFGVLEDWHPEKKDKFRKDELETWLGWMRRNDFIPKGLGPKTTTGRLFV